MSTRSSAPCSGRAIVCGSRPSSSRLPKDRHLWAKSYEREVKDVLGLQSEVARDIAGEIQLRLSPQEMVRMTQRKTVNPEAYELYLRGRYEWSKVSPQGVVKAIEFYQKALALDPGDARYSAGLGRRLPDPDSGRRHDASEGGMAKVKEYARRALAADDSSAEAHCLDGGRDSLRGLELGRGGAARPTRDPAQPRLFHGAPPSIRSSSSRPGGSTRRSSRTPWPPASTRSRSS